MTAAREYTAMTQDRKGGTQAVTVCAISEYSAMAKLLRMGYFRVLWVI